MGSFGAELDRISEVGGPTLASWCDLQAIDFSITFGVADGYCGCAMTLRVRVRQFDRDIKREVGPLVFKQSELPVLN